MRQEDVRQLLRVPAGSDRGLTRRAESLKARVSRECTLHKISLKLLDAHTQGIHTKLTELKRADAERTRVRQAEDKDHLTRLIQKVGCVSQLCQGEER